MLLQLRGIMQTFSSRLRRPHHAIPHEGPREGPLKEVQSLVPHEVLARVRRRAPPEVPDEQRAWLKIPTKEISALRFQGYSSLPRLAIRIKPT